VTGQLGPVPGARTEPLGDLGTRVHGVVSQNPESNLCLALRRELLIVGAGSERRQDLVDGMLDLYGPSGVGCIDQSADCGPDLVAQLRPGDDHERRREPGHLRVDPAEHSALLRLELDRSDRLMAAAPLSRSGRRDRGR
jgi:hypothetical protein